MCSILKLIILLQIYVSSHKCKAYVLQTTQQDSNYSDLSENKLMKLRTTRSPPMYEYIDEIMVRPTEIREPSNLQEIINYVGADKLSNPEPEPEGNQQQTLTYSEITKLLAFWQWAKEQNFYEMQTGQPDTNHNFVTVD